jgi:MYXO-CTERM domain-containing protein
VGGLGALLVQASVAAAASGPVTIKLTPGYGGPFEGPDEAIENGSPATEQSVATAIEKNGETFVVVAYMSGNVPDNLQPGQIKCSSFRMDPMQGPVLIADQVYLTQNENTDRPGNKPALYNDGKNILFGYGYAPNNGNTKTYVRLINEQCQSISDTVKVSNDDNQNIGAPHIVATGENKFFVTYYSNNGNETRGRLVTIDGNTITKGNNRNLINPTNIGRAPIAESNGYALTCTGRGNNRPPEQDLACTYIDGATGEVIWKNQTIVQADPDNHIYYNQATTVSLGAGRFALMAQQSDGNGKNSDIKGQNHDHVWILEPTMQGPNVRAHTDGNAIYATHATLVTGHYGEAGDQVLGIFESSTTDSGPSAITFLHYDSASLSFKPVDTALDQWIASIGPSDSGKLSNMYGNNPGTQGRNFLHGIGDVKNPGFGVDGGWMNDIETLFVLPYDGRVGTPDEPKNAGYVTFLPGKSKAPVVPQPPQEAPPAKDPGVTPQPPQTQDPGDGPAPGVDNPEEPKPIAESSESAGGCSVSADGLSGNGSGLALFGLALLGLAASRRRKES